MRIYINDTDFDIPFDLESITLANFIDYQKQYGNDLDKKLRSIIEKKYAEGDVLGEAERLLSLENHLDMEGLCWYSFWTKVDLTEASQHPSITPLLERYRIMRFMLNDTDDLIKNFPYEFDWNNETWAITDFKVNPASEMCFNEIITSKEVIRRVHAIGGNKWDSLIYLCVIYCRKRGEPFKDELIHEGSERMKELENLPLKYALSVAFFLSACVNIWLITSVSFPGGEPGTPNLN